jgi:hypothetical protein
MNVWHTSHWCDFRCRSDADIAAIIDLAHSEGALCSINHPKQGGPAWEYTTDLPVDSMEVWQGSWPHRNTESLTLWDRLLAQGRRLPAVGGSDYHCPSGEETNALRLGQPTTWVKVHERSVEAVLEAIAAGRSCISATPDGPKIELSATVNDETVGMGEAIEGWDDGMMRRGTIISSPHHPIISSSQFNSHRLGQIDPFRRGGVATGWTPVHGNKDARRFNIIR